MNIIIGTIVLFALAGYLWQKLETPERRNHAIASAINTMRGNIPRICVALIGAAYFAELLPQEFIERTLGDAAGARAIFLGTLLGVLTPGGAFVSFALAAAAFQAGASATAMVSYLSAWALFGITKMMAEELAIMGPGFIFTRIAVSFPIPVVVGYVSLWVSQWI